MTNAIHKYTTTGIKNRGWLPFESNTNKGISTAHTSDQFKIANRNLSILIPHTSGLGFALNANQPDNSLKGFKYVLIQKQKAELAL